MKIPNEFRCGKCNKLLAKFTSDTEFQEDIPNRTFIVEGEKHKSWKHRWYLEIKCPRCDKISKMPITKNYVPFRDDENEQEAAFYAMLEVNSEVERKEALEARNEASRNGNKL